VHRFFENVDFSANKQVFTIKNMDFFGPAGRKKIFEKTFGFC